MLPILLALLACGDGPPLPTTTGSACLQASPGGAAAALVETTVATADFAEGVRVGVWASAATPLLDDGAPVVVVLHGGTDQTALPLDYLRVDERLGAVQVYLNLPGGDGTPGEDDQRGPASRRAVAAALGYAAGEVADAEGCFIDERVPVALSDTPPALYGQSNGGNLAVAVLADAALALPELSGLVCFETPASAQFVTVELGSSTHPLELYEPGLCTWDAAGGLVCPVDQSAIGWEPEAERVDGTAGAVYYDIDGSGTYSGEDFAVWGQRVVLDGAPRIAFSPQLAASLDEAGLTVDAALDLEEAWSFWADRDASRLASAAGPRLATVPVILVGTKEDHVSGVLDHAHVSGLASALMASGATRVRVNPSRELMDAWVGKRLDWADNAWNQSMVPGDPGVAMEPDEIEVGASSPAYVAAALAEIWRDREGGR